MTFRVAIKAQIAIFTSIRNVQKAQMVLFLLELTAALEPRHLGRRFEVRMKVHMHLHLLVSNGSTCDICFYLQAVFSGL